MRFIWSLLGLCEVDLLIFLNERIQGSEKWSDWLKLASDKIQDFGRGLIPKLALFTIKQGSHALPQNGRAHRTGEMAPATLALPAPNRNSKDPLPADTRETSCPVASESPSHLGNDQKERWSAVHHWDHPLHPGEHGLFGLFLADPPGHGAHFLFSTESNLLSIKTYTFLSCSLLLSQKSSNQMALSLSCTGHEQF